MATSGATTTLPSESAAATGEKKGLTKYFSKMKTILRGGDSSKRLSTSSLKSPAATSSQVPPAEPAENTATGSRPFVTGRSTAELEKARRLAQKYNIDLEARDWQAIEVAERVEKPIRMRVHRSCHRCNTSYGSNKTCVICGHRRCDQCPRFPKKKTPSEKEREALAKDHSRPGDGLKRKHKYILTIPSKTGGQDLVRKRPLQRVRRNCHRCNTIYMPGNKACSKCAHVRCVDCPRDPPKKTKYPDGYPGDAPGSDDELDEADPRASTRAYTRPRRKISYSCHTCKTKFKLSELTCTTCGHEKCPDCPRVQPKKVDPQPDPEIVRRVQEKLKALHVTETHGIGGNAEPPPVDAPEVDPAVE